MFLDEFTRSLLKKFKQKKVFSLVSGILVDYTLNRRKYDTLIACYKFDVHVHHQILKLLAVITGGELRTNMAGSHAQHTQLKFSSEFEQF